MGLSVKCFSPIILVFAVFFFFLMFTVSRENTVKFLDGFSRKSHSLLALSILICSRKIGNKITIEL